MPRGDPRTSESGDRENVWRGAHRGPDRRPVEGHPRPGDATAEAEPGRGLRESGERFRLLAEHTGDLVIRHAPDTTVLYASPLAETITGWRAEELVGRRTLELVHPDDVPLLARAVEEMAEQREPGRLRLRVREPSGAYRWLESMFRPVRDERDRVVEVVSSTRDVREQVAAEEALRESEERYRLLAENSTDAIVRVGLDGRLRYASPALEEILGRPVESHDREGGAFVNVHPDDRPALGAWFRRIVRGDTGLPSLRCRVRGGDRGWFWIEMLGRLVRTADGVPSEVQGSVRDVTRQVEAEEALRESEARYRLLAGNSTDAIIRADLEGRVLDQTSAFEEILGRPMGPRLGFENIHPDDRDLVLARFTANATGEIERDTLRFRERHADGHYVWMEIRSRLVRDERGAPREVEFSARDVSAQVEAEVALRESEARFRMVAENASDMIARQDPSGRFLWVSPASTRILGYTPEELVGRLPDMFVAPEDRSRLVLAGGHPPTPGMTRQVRVRHKSGRTVWIEITYNPLFDDDGALVEAYTTVRDVTGLRQLDDERALRRVATAVAEGRPSAEVFALVADEARALLEGDTGAVMRWDGGETYEVVGTAGAIGPALGLRPPVAGSSSSAQVIRTGRPMRVDDYGVVDADTVAVFGAAAGIGCTLTAPIRAGGRIWGTVGVGSMLPGAFGSEAERRLARFAELVGPAVVNAAQRESLQSLAATDPLTGLANHRTFHERLAEEVARAARHGRPLAVAMLDLDHFKEINDALGHHAGDEVRAEVARRLAGAARPGDTVARVGGEEFAWIFPDCDAAGAERACERARAAVARDPAGGQGVRVTLSAGVCDLHTARRAEALPQLADGAL